MTPQASVPKYVLYGEALADVEERFLHVESIAERSRRHDWRILPHAHRDLHHTLLVTRGGGVLNTEDGDLRFGARTLIRVPRAYVHGFTFRPGTDGWVVTVSDALLGRIASEYPELSPLPGGAEVLPLPPRAADSRRLRHALGEVVREFRGHAPGRRAAIESALVTLLVATLRLIQAWPTPDVLVNRGDALLVARFRELIDAHFRTGLRITGYARRLAVSRERLRLACRRLTGSSPVQLLLQRRLLEARRGLLYTSMTVAQVAADSGFDDPAYFSRQFSRHAGEPPRAFRLQRRAAHGSPVRPVASAGRGGGSGAPGRR